MTPKNLIAAFKIKLQSIEWAELIKKFLKVLLIALLKFLIELAFKHLTGN